MTMNKLAKPRDACENARTLAFNCVADSEAEHKILSEGRIENLKLLNKKGKNKN